LLPIFDGYYQWCEVTGNSQSVFLISIIVVLKIQEIQILVYNHGSQKSKEPILIHNNSSKGS
jgi:hypothetical protein